MNNLLKWSILSVLLILTGTRSASALGQTDEKGPLKVVCSTSIITDVVSQIAGDKVYVAGLINNNQDPHSYEPAPKDIASIEKADIVFVNGFDLEENLLEVIYTNKKGKVVEVSNGILPIKRERDHKHHIQEDNQVQKDTDFHGNYDPHTWMSPINVLIWVENILAALTEADPDNAVYFKTRADHYKTRLQDLDAYIKKKLSSVPESRRIIVTDHDSLGYLARDYSLSIIGTIIPSMSTTSEVSPKDLADLIEKIKELRLHAVFIGSTAGAKIEKLGKTIRNELGYDIKIIPLLTGSLSKKGIAGDTYLDYIVYNIDQIIIGLKD